MRTFITILLASVMVGCGQGESPTTALRLPISNDPSTLDAHQARDLISLTATKMLYDGLTRIGPEGTPIPSLAERIEVSKDGCHYTFHLREARWSNGEVITAGQFVAAWNALFDPLFPSEMASSVAASGMQFFATDDQTLIVKLERPTAYFLELMALPTFAPQPPEKGLFNGPFSLVEWVPNDRLVFERNPHYWEPVALSRIELLVVPDEMTALYMFEEGKLDWAGSPLSRLPDVIVKTREVSSASLSATEWFKCNTEHPPFDNPKFRRALALAIDRQALSDYVIANHPDPATGLLPLCMGFGNAPYFSDGSIAEAKVLMEEIGNVPPFTLTYPQNDLAHTVAQAVQQQWKEALGLDVILQAMEGKVFLSAVSQKDYQIASKNWLADFNDPINFLGLFRDRESGFNETGWENRKYRLLVDAIEKEADPKKRGELVAQAEALLVEEMPVIPLFHRRFSYLKRNDLEGVVLSPAGAPDFKWAHIE